MTTLDHIYIVAHDVKATCINFEIQKRMFYPFNFKGKFHTTSLTAIHAPAINDELSVKYTDATGEYTVFIGKITKITPVDRFIYIEATSDMIRLFNWYLTAEWVTSSPHDGLMAEMIDSTFGPSLTYTNNVSNHQYFSYYKVTNTSAIDALRKLCLASADGASDYMTVFYQDATDIDNVIMQEYGEVSPSSAITLSHANGSLLSRVVYDDVSQEIVNKVIAYCGHGVETRIANDVSGLGTTSATMYGTRTLKCYRPETFTQADARITTDTILRLYSSNIARFNVDVKHSALHANSTHYPVLNTNYTVIDAPTNQTYSTMTCIAHTMRWPSFRDTCIFGRLFVDTGDYFLSQQGNITNVENSTANQIPYQAQAYATGGTVGTPDEVEIVFATESYDLGSCYNNSNGRFTAAVSGLHTITYQVTISNLGAGHYFFVHMHKNGSTGTLLQISQINSGTVVTGEWTGSLDAGDYVSLWGETDDDVGRTYTSGLANTYIRCKRIV